MYVEKIKLGEKLRFRADLFPKKIVKLNGFEFRLVIEKNNIEVCLISEPFILIRKNKNTIKLRATPSQRRK